MACRGFWECLLKLFNFLLTISGLAMVGYGIYLLVLWNKASSPSGGGGDVPAGPTAYNPELLKLGRPMLLLVSLSDDILDKLPKAWGESREIWRNLAEIPLRNRGDSVETKS